jgi:hypothetical protein
VGLIVLEHRRIAQAPRTDPEVRKATSLGRGTIGPEYRITTGQERLTTIGRKTIMLRVPEEFHALALGPTSSRTEAKQLRVLTVRRMDRENHGAAKQRPAREHRITVLTYRTTTM